MYTGDDLHDDMMIWIPYRDGFPGRACSRGGDYDDYDDDDVYVTTGSLVELALGAVTLWIREPLLEIKRAYGLYIYLRFTVLPRFPQSRFACYMMIVCHV